MKTKTDKEDKKYKNWDDPVAIAFDKAGRRGIQYKKPLKTDKELEKKKEFWLYHPGLVNPIKGSTGRYRPAGKDIDGVPMIEMEFKRK